MALPLVAAERLSAWASVGQQLALVGTGCEVDMDKEPRKVDMELNYFELKSLAYSESKKYLN